ECARKHNCAHREPRSERNRALQQRSATIALGACPGDPPPQRVAPRGISGRLCGILVQRRRSGAACRVLLADAPTRVAAGERGAVRPPQELNYLRSATL